MLLTTSIQCLFESDGLELRVTFFFLTTIALAVFAHFKNNNEETQIDVYFPNEIQ